MTLSMCLKPHAARHGLPVKVFSDNSPFKSNLPNFNVLRRNMNSSILPARLISHKVMGKTDPTVRTLKRLMKKAKQENSGHYLSQLDFLNTLSEQLLTVPCPNPDGRKNPNKTAHERSTPTATITKIALQRAKDIQPF